MARSGEREEQVAALLVQNKQAGLEISALRSDVQHLKALLNAVWSIVRERLELRDEDLVKVHKQIVDAERITGRTSEPCPHCGRPLQDRAALCIYCGQVVEKRDLF